MQNRYAPMGRLNMYTLEPLPVNADNIYVLIAVQNSKCDVIAHKAAQRSHK
jgi:hypothetical protein